MLLIWGLSALDVNKGWFSQPGKQDAQLMDVEKDFVARVVSSTERIWGGIFRNMGRQYKEPSVVLFSGSAQSACGMAQSAKGPFYCPLDQKVYIDLSFYQDMKTRLGAAGDFALAYVIAREVGHHVQNLFGIAEQVTQARTWAPAEDGNALSVRMELQADCFAGLWARETNATDQSDIDAIRDGRLQVLSQGYAMPDAITHGSSEQRVRWFMRGLEATHLRDCDTFETNEL